MIDTLIHRDRETKKRIAVVGDSMTDVWRHGHQTACQDGCLRFAEMDVYRTPGGAANAARQLARWNAEAYLVAPLDCPDWATDGKKLNFDLCFICDQIPVKTRYVDQAGRIVFRHDDDGCRIEMRELYQCRELTLAALREMRFDAVLLADYDKGFVDRTFARQVIRFCVSHNIPVVVDGKKPPECYQGAILKCNGEYALAHGLMGNPPMPATVITHGPEYPQVYSEDGLYSLEGHASPVECRSHVGAGDCFASHLVLALAHGYCLRHAATIAHAAGRIFVQHLHGRPPWPHEIRRDLDGVGGKVLDAPEAKLLRQSLAGKRVVFTNGCFRLCHAGHAWFLRWARQQGDVLVVGVNDDLSACALRNGDFILPLQDRVEVLASLEAVDWVIPFAESTPETLIKELHPDVLCKGNEYAGQPVPGHDLVAQTLFAPESPFPGHCTDLIAAVRA